MSKFYHGSYLSNFPFFKSFLYQAFIIFISALIIGISANLTIPAYPIPFTLQSVVILILGAMLGRNRAILMIIIYIFLGFMGAPFFSNGRSGLEILNSPTLGFIIGFIASAYVAGWGANKGYDKKLLSGWILFAIAHQIVFVFGVIYLSLYLNIPFMDALKKGYLPFMGVDVLKFTFATLFMWILWRFKMA